MGDGGRRESKWEGGREREWFKYQPLRGCVILFSANAAAVKPWPVSHSRQQPPEERSIRTLAGPLTRSSDAPVPNHPRRDLAAMTLARCAFTAGLLFTGRWRSASYLVLRFQLRIERR